MDPVRQAEIEHEMEQDAVQKRKDLFLSSGRFDEWVIAKYHEYLEDPIRLWEALGPDGFQAPCPNLNTIFGNCQNKTAEVLFEAHLACAIKGHSFTGVRIETPRRVCRKNSWNVTPSRECGLKQASILAVLDALQSLLHGSAD